MIKNRHFRSSLFRLTLWTPFAVVAAAITSCPSAEAQGYPIIWELSVDIRNGGIDVNEDGFVNTADDAGNILLFFDDAAPIRVDIVNGLVDVTESGGVNCYDSLPNVDLFDGASNQVDIRDGWIDVDENGAITDTDDISDVTLLQMSGPGVIQVNVMNGAVDVNRDGKISSADDTYAIAAFDDAAPILLVIRDGKVDVTQDGIVNASDALKNADLTVPNIGRCLALQDPSGAYRSEQVDVIAGYIDVNEDGWITPADDSNGVRLITSQLFFSRKVNILKGGIDVNLDGEVNDADDSYYDYLLLVDEAAPLLVNISNGAFTTDDLSNVDLNHYFGRNQADIINGLIDVDENGSINESDLAFGVRLFGISEEPGIDVP